MFASELAFRAACYIMLKYVESSVKITFVLGKSWLDPIRLVKFFILELCAAVLAAKMYESI